MGGQLGHTCVGSKWAALSEWTMHPATGLRRWSAMRSALIAIGFFMGLSIE